MTRPNCQPVDTTHFAFLLTELFRMGFTWEQAEWAELNLHIGAWKYDGKDPVLLLKHFYPTREERAELREQVLKAGQLVVDVGEMRRRLREAYERGRTDEHNKHIKLEQANGQDETTKQLVEQWRKIVALEEALERANEDAERWRKAAERWQHVAEGSQEQGRQGTVSKDG